MDKTKFVYEIYIRSTTEVIWKALIEPEITMKYWYHVNVSDWKTGSKWEHQESVNDKTVLLVGKVVEFSPPKKLVLTWAFPEDLANEEKHTRVSLDMEMLKDVVHFTVTHDMLDPGSPMHEGIIEGWPKVLSNLKTLMETGKPLPMLW